jgi:transposase-like protein
MELRMSQQERDWLKYLSAYEQGNLDLTQGGIAALLGCDVRTVRRRLQRYRAAGDAGLVHASRGRRSNRAYSEELRERALDLVARQYADFGPTLAAEKLAERDGLLVGCETLRGWMTGAELWKPKPRKVTHRQWRERKACFGELVQVDTSVHDWFEGRGEKAYLITLIDDATSRVFMRFYEAESTATNMTHLRDYIARFGRPRAFYGDKASHFRTTRSATVQEELEGLEAQTQIERALCELDITYITAHSPQAKGRVERSFGTAQDRLVKELRLRNISDIETANSFLEECYMPLVNERFAVPAAADVDAHRPAEGFDLDAIFSFQETRTVTRDYTVRFANRRFQIRKASAAAGLVGSKVVVEQRLDASLHLRWRGDYLVFAEITAPARAATAVAPPLGLRPRSRTTAEGTAVTPKPDHPWRRRFLPERQPQRQ